MIGNDGQAQMDAAKAAAQAQVEDETGKQAASGSDAADLAGNVVVEGVGEVIAGAIGVAVEGAGTALSAAGEVAVAIIGGVFEGL